MPLGKTGKVPLKRALAWVEANVDASRRSHWQGDGRPKTAPDRAQFSQKQADPPIRRYHKGVARREWVKTSGARNEPLDCRILAQAALEGLKASGMRLEIEAKRVREPSAKQAPAVYRSKWI